MRIFYLIFIGAIFNISIVSAQANRVQVTTNDSIAIKAKKLKYLYTLSTSSSSGDTAIYQQQFFDTFPNTFKELDDLYGYENSKPAPLYSENTKHIYELFNNLNTINDTLYYKKIIAIAIGGHWDADAIGEFQDGLQKRVLINPKLATLLLKDMSENRIKSFWLFFLMDHILKMRSHLQL